jgi:hypothetical protein
VDGISGDVISCLGAVVVINDRATEKSLPGFLPFTMHKNRRRAQKHLQSVLPQAKAEIIIHIIDKEFLVKEAN